MAINFLNSINITGSITTSTTGTFGGNVTLSSTSPLLYLTNTTSGTGKNWRLSSATNGKFFITQEGVVDALSFAHTSGNATFAGSITGTSAVFATGSLKFVIKGNDNGEGQLILRGNADPNNYWEIGRESAARGEFQIREYLSGSFITTPRFLVARTTGNVAIGYTATDTAATGNKLAVNGSATFAGNVFLPDNKYATFGGANNAWELQIGVVGDNAFIEKTATTNGDLFIKNNGSGKGIIFQNGNATALTIDSSQNAIFTGKVGIGTTNPGAKLQVGSRGTAGALTPPVTDGILFDFHNDGSPYTRHAAIISQAGDASESVIDFWTKVASGTSAKKMTILGSGNVGIGTSSPSEKLDTPNIAIGGSTITGYTANKLRIDNNGGTSRFYSTGANSTTKGQYVFHVTSSNGSLNPEVMRITSAGNVGIGTNSPTARLDIVTSSATGTNSIDRHVRFRADNGEQRFDFNIGRSGNSALLGMYNESETETVRVATNGNSYFNGGNVGIGTTSPNVLGFLETGLNINAGSSSSTTLQQAGLVISGSSDADDQDDFGYLSFTNNHSTLSSDRVAEIRAQKAGSNVNTGQLAFLTANGTALNESMVLGETGLLKLSQYGAGTLVTDASGNITVSSGGGAGGPFLPLAGGTMTGNTIHGDNVKSIYGSSTDFEIFHNSTTNANVIQSNASRQLAIQQDNLFIGNQAATEIMITAIADGAVSLYFNGSKKFETTAGGTSITGTIDSTGTISVTGANSNIKIGTDTGKFFAGASNDLRIYHDGTNSYIENETGNLTIFNKQDDGDVIFATDNGSGGTTAYLTLDGSITKTIASKDIHFDGAVEATFGSNASPNIVIGSGLVTATTFSGDLNGTINTATTAATQANATNNTTVATTAFVKNLIGTIPAGLVFQGTWDARTAAEGGAAGDRGNPALANGVGTTGNFYIVSNSGSVNLDGVTDWVTGDWAVFIEQGGTDAWEKIDNSSVLDGAGTGQTVALWSGAGTSNTLTNAPITVSGNDSTFTGKISLSSNKPVDWGGGSIRAEGNTLKLVATTLIDLQNKTQIQGNLTVNSDSSAIGLRVNGRSADDIAEINMYENDGTTLLGRIQTRTTVMNIGSVTSVPLALKTGGTTALTLDTSQNATFEGDVEIRTGKKLILQRPNNGVATEISTDSTGAMILNSINSEGFFFNNNGTTAFKLDPVNATFAGDVNVTGANLNFLANDAAQIKAKESMLFTIDSDNNQTSRVFQFKEGSGNTLMTIQEAGNVGIGTTNPRTKLEVGSTGSLGAVTNKVISTTIDGGYSTANSLQYNVNAFIATTFGTTDIFASTGGETDKNFYTGLFSDNSFFNGARYSVVQGGAERLTVARGGNVGIGTTTPELPLEVNGSILVDVFDQTQTEEGIFFRPGYTATNKYNISILAFAHESVPSFNDGLSINGYDGVSFCTGSNTRNEKMRIKANGNVGIGTIDPARKLHVDGTLGTAALRIDKAGDKIVYLGTGSSSATLGDDTILQLINEGVEKVRIFTEGSSFFNGGNVGIGNTSPSAELTIGNVSDTAVKIIKIANDTTSVYRYATLADAVLAWTCTSYHNAEVIITASQTNGGGDNNLYIRGIWSNNHTTHHWRELENVGSLTGSAIAMSVGQDPASGTNSGELKLDFTYTSGSFAQLNVRVTDFFGTHSYTIT